MKNLNQLGKTCEVIGKMLFYLLTIVSIIVVISFNLSNLEEKPEVSIAVGAILGSILAVVLIYYFWRLLFRPIYSLNKTVRLKINSQLTEKEYKSKWAISLICSLLFGLLFIVGTFGISLILMIPHYILLTKTRSV